MIEQVTHPSFWLNACLSREPVHLFASTKISGRSNSSVWDCRIDCNGHIDDVVLKVYGPHHDTPSGLDPVAIAQKHALALAEFAHATISVPRLLGFAVRDNQAALLMEKIVSIPWQPIGRLQAAIALAALHRLSLNTISEDLTHLITQSTSNRLRVLNSVQSLANTLDLETPQWRQSYGQLAEQVHVLTEGGEPVSDLVSLVHGDYFSANLLCREEDICIIDWDLLAVGDPMWDLGFLIGADRNLSFREVEAVIAAYRQVCPVDMPTLMWHKRCWDVSWELRKVHKRVILAKL